MSQQELQPSVAETQYVVLPHKSSVKMATKYIPAKDSSSSSGPILVIFLNGLMTTMDTWASVIEQFQSQPSSHSTSFLCYDRYGQGESTDHDPQDVTSPDPSHGHDLTSSITDLDALIHHFSPSPSTKIILVSNSIGCAISRLYTQIHPSKIFGLLFLDSIISNINLVDIFPDPSSPSFSPTTLPASITIPDLMKTRAITSKVFSPSVGNKEGLSRKNLAELLPSSTSPKLSPSPYLTIVSHGASEFALQSTQIGGQSPAPILEYLNPYWHKYHEDLTQIVDPERTKPVIEAVGAGHFVQRDRPDLVVQELKEMVEKLGGLKH